MVLAHLLGGGVKCGLFKCPAARNQSSSRKCNDHEQASARTSGVAYWIVVAPAMEPPGYDITMTA